MTKGRGRYAAGREATRQVLEGVDPVAVALNEAVQQMDRSTGISHSFLVHYRKVDGTEAAVQQVTVIAMTWRDAWGRVGDAVTLFMNSEHGRFVTAIHADPMIENKSGRRPG